MTASPDFRKVKCIDDLHEYVNNLLLYLGYQFVDKSKFMGSKSKKMIYTKVYPNGPGCYATGYSVDFVVFHHEHHKDLLGIQCRWQGGGENVDNEYPFDVASIAEGDYNTIIIVGDRKSNTDSKNWLFEQAGKSKLMGVFYWDEFRKSVSEADASNKDRGKITCNCKRHIEDDKRKSLEEIMKGLTEYQGGEGRHKCPYCAYERGWQDAIAELTNPVTSRHTSSK